MKLLYPILASFALLISCIKEDPIALRSAAEILPGSWKISSVQLPRYGSGITYQGNTFVADTILYDVGTIEISSFDWRDMDISDVSTPKVLCDLEIGGEHFPMSINGMHPGEDLYIYFRSNAPDGSHTIVNPGEEFLYTSHIFMNNYLFNVIDADTIQLLKASDPEGHVITLARQ